MIASCGAGSSCEIEIVREQGTWPSLRYFPLSSLSSSGIAVCIFQRISAYRVVRQVRSSLNSPQDVVMRCSNCQIIMLDHASMNDGQLCPPYPTSDIRSQDRRELFAFQVLISRRHELSATEASSSMSNTKTTNILLRFAPAAGCKFFRSASAEPKT
jgi:hypothetical protein